MANHISHASLPYPIKNARYTLLIPYLDADGDPTDPTTPDTEFSLDNGSGGMSNYADCAEEVTTITGSNGSGYITLTGAETNGSALALCAKVASGPKATLATLYPRNLPILESGTAGAGAAGSITLASGTYTGLNLAGCFVRTTGGTGGGGTGGANNQARRITSYNTGSRVATIAPNWETTPSSDTTYDILLPEGVLVPMLTALAPTTLARTLDVSAGGEAGVDWANVGSPTTTLNLSGTTVKTATDVETDTADIQSRLPAALGANGNIKADIRDYNGTAGTFTGGRPEVNTTHWAGTAAGSATVRADLINIAGAAVSTSTAQLGVNVVNFGGSAGTFASGIPAVNATQISSDSVAADNLESAYDGTGYGRILVGTTIATLASQTSFTLTAGSADDSAYKGCVVVIEDASTAAQKAVGVVSAYTGASKTITLLTDPAVFTMAAGDKITIIADRSLKPTVDNQNLNVSVGGAKIQPTNTIGDSILTDLYIPTIADAIWDEARSGHVLAGSFGEYVKADVVAISGDATAADNLEAAADGTGYNIGGGSIVAASVTAGVTLADGAITEAKISTPSEASGRPTGILAMIRRVWEWHSNKRTRDRSTGTVLLRNDADNGTLETQTQSTSGNVDTQTEGA